MSVINVDELERTQKGEVEKKKGIEKSKKKFSNKIDIKMRKRPINNEALRPSAPIVQDDEYKPLEWLSMFVDGYYKILSIPAGDKAAEMEQRIKQSKDMSYFLNKLPIQSFINSCPVPIMYGLSYASHLIAVKGFSGQAIKNNVSNVVNQNKGAATATATAEQSPNMEILKEDIGLERVYNDDVKKYDKKKTINEINEFRKRDREMQLNKFNLLSTEEQIEIMDG